MSKEWSDTDLNLLEDYWKAGYDLVDIADILDRSLESIRHKKRRMGLLGRRDRIKSLNEYQYAKFHDTSQRKMRKCISRVVDSCLGEFMSEHKGHRICKRCRDSISKMGTSTIFLEPHDARKQ